MLLSELFNPRAGAPYELQYADDAYSTEFKVGDIQYKMVIQRAAAEPASMWDIEFWTANVKRPTSTSYDQQEFAEYTRKTHGISGTGNAATVFATVVNVVRNAMQQIGHIDVLTFTAREANRQSLYARIVKTLLPNWVMKKEGSLFVVVNPQTKYDEDQIRYALSNY